MEKIRHSFERNRGKLYGSEQDWKKVYGKKMSQKTGPQKTLGN